MHFPDDRYIDDELAVDAKKSHRIEEFLQFVQRVVHRKTLAGAAYDQEGDFVLRIKAA